MLKLIRHDGHDEVFESTYQWRLSHAAQQDPQIFKP